MLQMGAMLPAYFPNGSFEFHPELRTRPVGVVFGKVSLNYDFFHWCHGSFEFFHTPTLAFGCVAMAGQFEHLSIQVFDNIFLGFCDGDQLCPVRTHCLYVSSSTSINSSHWLRKSTRPFCPGHSLHWPIIHLSSSSEQTQFFLSMGFLHN